jgi:hypothetical protein
MNIEKAKAITMAAALAPAVMTVAAGTVQSGIERTNCLIESLAACPIVEWGVEPDPPPQPVGPIPMPGFATVATNSGTVALSNRIVYLNGKAVDLDATYLSS